MKFYVASGVENGMRVNEVAAILTAQGHNRTYDWTTHGSVKSAADDFKRNVAETESNAVLSASLVVLLLPGGKGTHAELGMAIAKASSGKDAMRILVWSDSPDPFDGTNGFCVFYHHPAVERIVCPFPALLERLSHI